MKTVYQHIATLQMNLEFASKQVRREPSQDFDWIVTGVKKYNY